MRGSMESRVEGLIKQLQSVTDKSVCVGFGVSGPEQVGAPRLAACHPHACMHACCALVVTRVACLPAPPTRGLLRRCPPGPQAQQIKAWGAEGVICGSALVKALGESGSPGGRLAEAAGWVEVSQSFWYAQGLPAAVALSSLPRVNG